MKHKSKMQLLHVMVTFSKQNLAGRSSQMWEKKAVRSGKFASLARRFSSGNFSDVLFFHLL